MVGILWSVMSDRPYTAGRKYEVVDRDEFHDEVFGQNSDIIKDPGVLYDSWQENGIPEVFIVTDWERYPSEENEMYHDLLFRFPNSVETKGGLYKHEIDALEEAGVLEHVGFEDMS
jgi:hypothetical protein